MTIFTVTKPGGTRDYEFAAYTRLLEDLGVDVADVPRVPEPRTQRRWLYSWQRQEEAEGFARELQVRTRDGSWHVEPLPAESEQRGPVAPLDIYEVRNEDQGFMYYLAPSSQNRIIRAHPHSPLYPITVSPQQRDGLKKQHGDRWWDEMCRLLTGLTREQVHALGGYRVILPYGEIGHEELPEIPSHG